MCYFEQGKGIDRLVAQTNNRGLIKGQELGELASCEDDFCPPGLTILRKISPIKKFSSKTFCLPVKPAALLLKMLMKPLQQVHFQVILSDILFVFQIVVTFLIWLPCCS